MPWVYFFVAVLISMWVTAADIGHTFEGRGRLIKLNVPCIWQRWYHFIILLGAAVSIAFVGRRELLPHVDYCLW